MDARPGPLNDGQLPATHLSILMRSQAWRLNFRRWPDPAGKGLAVMSATVIDR